RRQGHLLNLRQTAVAASNEGGYLPSWPVCSAPAAAECRWLTTSVVFVFTDWSPVPSLQDLHSDCRWPALCGVPHHGSRPSGTFPLLAADHAPAPLPFAARFSVIDATVDSYIADALRRPAAPRTFSCRPQSRVRRSPGGLGYGPDTSLSA